MRPESYTPEQWQQVGPILDEALARLREKDRAVVTLRYLEGQGIPEVAVALGISEAAVSKRLTRSLSKLRSSFARKGVQLPIDGISRGDKGATYRALVPLYRVNTTYLGSATAT